MCISLTEHNALHAYKWKKMVREVYVVTFKVSQCLFVMFCLRRNFTQSSNIT